MQQSTVAVRSDEAWEEMQHCCGHDTLLAAVAWRGFSTFGSRTVDGHGSVTIAPAVEEC